MVISKDPQALFHDEKVKDAMTFNDVMKSVHNSTGILGGARGEGSLA
jgi:hypothetical protein